MRAVTGSARVDSQAAALVAGTAGVGCWTKPSSWLGVPSLLMYIPAVDPRRAFDTGDYRNLLRLDDATGGRLVLAPTLAERLHARGLRLAGVSSGSTGSAFLLNFHGARGRTRSACPGPTWRTSAAAPSCTLATTAA